MFLNKKKFIAICLVMLVCATLLTACVAPHECKHICAYCGKCADSTCHDKVCHDKCKCPPLKVEHTNWTMLTGTIYETKVHKYVTNRQGANIAIVGGIHGDEIAGWTAALQLVDLLPNEYKICGQILLIPQGNILADNRKERYPAVGISGHVLNGVKYSDLNRSFPNGRSSSATTATISISNAIIAEVEAFNADYIVDLHESQHSWGQSSEVSTSLGDTLVFSNEVFFMEDLLSHYNKNYLEKDDVQFTSADSTQLGSFNYYFTKARPDCVVFTIETNRQRVNKVDTMPLKTRVRQQNNILSALFDIVWERK